MAAETVEHAAEHSGEFDMAEVLTHHMVNSQELELPWGTVHLPTLDLFGYELPKIDGLARTLLAADGLTLEIAPEHFTD